jgi:hypothetical protein
VTIGVPVTHQRQDAGLAITDIAGAPLGVFRENSRGTPPQLSIVVCVGVVRRNSVAELAQRAAGGSERRNVHVDRLSALYAWAALSGAIEQPRIELDGVSRIAVEKREEEISRRVVTPRRPASGSCSGLPRRPSSHSAESM